jgi:NAD(P) transhydrogenase subunit beta
MTAMPQMVGIFNGFGGGASAIVAAAEFFKLNSEGGMTAGTGVAIMLGSLVGAVTLSGSMIAFGKLQGIVTGAPVTYPYQKTISAAIFGVILLLGVILAIGSGNVFFFVIFCLLSLAIGVLLVIPIGGADMPVVISLLNSYSGLAASFAGFVVNNMVLIISGALVGAAGLILTAIMCKAMARSLANVVFGAFGTGDAAPGAVEGAGSLTVRQTSPEETAVMMAYAKLVIIVPGYGMAVAQAQHTIREMADLLEARGVEVKYAIHPVAGRMPGHMNVLLAEANVPYDKLYDMADINSEFERADVSFVLGANDVVNPGARTDQSSPIYGMPILDVDKSNHTIVVKRSMNPGFAGIENPLFFLENTSMLFGDAQKVAQSLVAEIKEV